MKLPGLGVFFTSLLLLVPFAERARAGVEVRRESPNSATTWIRSGDDGRFVLDRIGIDANGWPVRLSHQVFGSAAESTRAARTAGFFSMGLAALFAHSEKQAQEIRDPRVSAPLWQVRSEWSADWEMKYAAWIEKNIDRDFFVKTNQASDCADLAYSARWIFARENGLPVANRLAGTGDFFTQRSVKREWMNLPTDPDWRKDRRFRAALDYLLAMTYTHTLMGDSYPVALDPATFRAGIHHLSLTDDTGHTLLIHRTDFANPSTLPFLVLYSTLPIAVRELEEQAYFYTDQPKPETGGFLRMRWPITLGDQVSLRKAEEMPFYSLQQYAPELMQGQSSFGLAIMRKLKPTFSLVTALQSAISGVVDMIHERVQLVESGFAFCAKRPGGCPVGSSTYEDWSTPSRDARILAQISLLGSIASLGNFDERKRMDALLAHALQSKVIELGGEGIELNLIFQALRRGLTSADPNLPIALRWGVTPEAQLEIIKTRLAEGFAARAQARASAGATCIGNTTIDCAPGGYGYERENTFVIDTALKENATLVSMTCLQGPSEPTCARLRSLLDSTSLTIGAESHSISGWLDRALALNSDPRVSAEARDGVNSPYAKLEITGARTFSLRGNLAVREESDTGREILFVRSDRTFEPRRFRQGVSLLDADLGANRGLFARGSALFTADLGGNGEASVATANVPIQSARIIGGSTEIPRRILYATGTSVALLEIRDGVWREVFNADFHARGRFAPKFDREFFTYRRGSSPSDEWSIVDLKAKQPRAIAIPGVPASAENRPDFALPKAIYLQVVQNSSASDSLRTVRIDRSTGDVSLAWHLQGFVSLVSEDEQTAVFSDLNGAVETFYRAPIHPDGTLGARERLGTDYYRQRDYAIFYGGNSEMRSYSIGTDGKLLPLTLQPGEQWFKHVRGDSVVVLLENGDYAIRKVTGGKLFAEDGFLGMPVEGAGEDPYRYLVHEARSNAHLRLTDARHPDRFSIVTGPLLGDPLENVHEPWSADSLGGVGAVDLDAGTVINLGARLFWIGD